VLVFYVLGLDFHKWVGLLVWMWWTIQGIFMLCVVNVVTTTVIGIDIGAPNKLQNFCATHVFIHNTFDCFDLEKQWIETHCCLICCNIEVLGIKIKFKILIWWILYARFFYFMVNVIVSTLSKLLKSNANLIFIFPWWLKNHPRLKHTKEIAKL